MSALIYPAKSFDIYEDEVAAASLQEMFDDGYQSVIHYYSHTNGKTLTRDSALASTAIGLWIAAVWEARGSDIATFTPEQGIADAKAAVAEAQAVGQPKGSAIYFAVDFGPTEDQVQAVLIYLTAAATIVIGAGYKVGIYACGAILLAAYGEGGVFDYDWLAGALGWPGSRTYVSPYDPSGKPAITQGLEARVDGLDIDPDTVYREAGLFQVAA